MRQRRKMNKWEVDEHEQWSEKVRSQHFCPPLLDKNRNYDRIIIMIKNKENRSLSQWG